ncbi:tetratricopeptide repeat protein 32 isoform X3 [Mastomys coucha]|uniref:tetratricopeptide repeat protein 32 isoform X3 n=1 Tax=Mastomys coucha TaxID=35658 RepID=UPI00126273B5|nr:tetratricopeptide repeat protein 32 isoform X3 [Mastomys coucha]
MAVRPSRQGGETLVALAMAQARFARGEFAEARELYTTFIGQCARHGSDPKDQKRTSDSLKTEVSDCCEPPCGCRELSLDPLLGHLFNPARVPQACACLQVTPNQPGQVGAAETVPWILEEEGHSQPQ